MMPYKSLFRELSVCRADDNNMHFTFNSTGNSKSRSLLTFRANVLRSMQPRELGCSELQAISRQILHHIEIREVLSDITGLRLYQRMYFVMICKT